MAKKLRDIFGQMDLKIFIISNEVVRKIVQIMDKLFNDFVEERVIRKHSCAKYEETGNLLILYIKYEETSEYGWVLSSVSRATKSDVIEGEADFIGEVLYGMTISIDYCPFCGKYLEPSKKSGMDPIAVK